MKQLKFRAWDKSKKVFYYSELVCIVNERGNYYFQGESSAHPDFFESFDEEMEELKINEYIGLKDMNEVEIYEGDIVTHNGHKDYCYPMEIKKIDGAFCIGKSGIGVSEFNSWATIRDSIAGAKRRGTDLVLEVIGNIYENEDLLK